MKVMMHGFMTTQAKAAQYRIAAAPSADAG